MLTVYQAGTKNVRLFTESEIFWLQDLFMLPGMHGLTTPMLTDGRELIYTMLDTLNWYTHPACLTMTPEALRSSVYDVHHLLSTHENSINNEEIARFFFESFNADFLWIELSPALINTSWYRTFEQQLISFDMHKNMPVVLLSAAQ